MTDSIAALLRLDIHDMLDLVSSGHFRQIEQQSALQSPNNPRHPLPLLLVSHMEHIFDVLERHHCFRAAGRFLDLWVLCYCFGMVRPNKITLDTQHRSLHSYTARERLLERKSN
jgi:hypothetical protein